MSLKILRMAKTLNNASYTIDKEEIVTKPDGTRAMVHKQVAVSKEEWEKYNG